MNGQKQKSYWQRAKGVARKAAKSKSVRHVTGSAWKTFWASGRWKWIFLTVAVGALLWWSGVFAWDMGVFSSSPERVEEGQNVTTVTPPARLTPQPTSDYAWRDSSGKLQLDKIPAAGKPIDATVTMGQSGKVLALDVKDPLLPEFKPRSASLDAKAYCAEEAGAACDSVSVVLTPARRPLTDAMFEPSVGVNSQLRRFGDSQLHVGADVLRLWGFRFGGGLNVGADTAGLRASPMVDMGAQVKRNVQLYCGREVYGGGVRCGTDLTF